MFVYLVLLYSLCCLFLQVVQEFLVSHPCLVYLLAHRVLCKQTDEQKIVLNGSYRIKDMVVCHPSLPRTSPVSAMKILQTEQTLSLTCYILLPRGKKDPQK